jgi:transposase-like protein
LIGLPRASFYYQAQPESEQNLKLMRLLDEQYTRTPFYGIRRMTAWLQTQGYQVNHKRVARLLRLMGLEAIYQKPRLSQPGAGHQIYPYLLRGVKIERINQVWSTDITYIRLQGGFVYLVAVIDWHSRYVLSWEVSPTLETDFCTSALNQALKQATPEIFNTDQGVQFTSSAFTSILKERKIAISMDGRGSGAASNTKRSICTTTKVSPKPSRVWTNTSTSTTGSGFISRSTTKPRKPSTSGDRPKNGSPAIHLNFPDFLSRQWGTPYGKKTNSSRIIGNPFPMIQGVLASLIVQTVL